MEGERYSWQSYSQDATPQRENRSSLPRLQTQMNQGNGKNNNNRFSYTTTPAVAQGATFEPPPQAAQTRPYTYIDEEPMSADDTVYYTNQSRLSSHFTAHNEVAPVASPPTHHAVAAYPEERKSPSPVPNPAFYQQQQQQQQQQPQPQHQHFQQQAILPPHEVHPAHYAPYADATLPSRDTTSPYSATSQGFQLHPYAQHQFIPSAVEPMTYPPMPHSPQYPSTDTKSKSPISPLAPLAFHHTPDTPTFSHPDVPSTPRTPAYTPASPLGPNASAFHMGHRPGQIAHPLSASPKEWQHSTLSPSATCLSSLVCPCITYGKVQHRLAQRARKAEATDLLAYNTFNSDCGLFAALCGLCGILSTIQRSRTRRAYDIEGGYAGDCLRGCACCCCTVALNEREITTREEERRKLAGPVTSQYVRPGAMTYPL